MSLQRYTLLSLFVSTLLCGIKFLAYFLTKSVAIYSDAMESIVNIFSALFAFLGSKIAEKPPDKEHPYGHGKAEYIVSSIEGLFILFAAVSILYQAIERILNQKALENATEGLILITVSAVANLSLSYFLYKKAKSLNSSLLFSHATHIFTDVLTTIGTMIAIILIDKYRLLFLDPIIGIVIGINVVYLGYKITKTSLSSLLDRQIEREKREKIEELIENVLTQKKLDHSDNFSYCIKRTRRAGRKGFIELYINVPSYLSVKDAHALCDEIEREIKTIFPEIEVIIHVEPSP